MPVMSEEEAVADILTDDDAPITAFDAPRFIEELAKRGYRIMPIQPARADDEDWQHGKPR